MCLFGLVPLPHSRAAALCASTLLPNWTLDVANKFAVWAISRSPGPESHKKIAVLGAQ